MSLLVKNHLFIGHIGDSFAILLENRTAVISNMHRAHNFREQPQDYGRALYRGAQVTERHYVVHPIT